jgi:hypothetical protein
MNESMSAHQWICTHHAMMVDEVKIEHMNHSGSNPLLLVLAVNGSQGAFTLLHLHREKDTCWFKTKDSYSKQVSCRSFCGLVALPMKQCYVLMFT